MRTPAPGPAKKKLNWRTLYERSKSRLSQASPEKENHATTVHARVSL